MVQNSDDLPTLVGQTGPLNGQRWVLKKSILIGRDEMCDIVIPNRQVSRHHARVKPDPQGVLLEDLGSKNGTHCNGQPISEPIYLQDGDIVQIAIAQQFVFISSDATLPLEAISSFAVEAALSQERCLRLEKRSRRVWINNKEIVPPLSVSQFQLLEALYENRDQVVTRDELIKAVWGEDYALGVSEQALDALVRRLRDRLASVDPTHAYVVTIRGHGLRLDNPMITE